MGSKFRVLRVRDGQALVRFYGIGSMSFPVSVSSDGRVRVQKPDSSMYFFPEMFAEIVRAVVKVYLDANEMECDNNDSRYFSS